MSEYATLLEELNALTPLVKSEPAAAPVEAEPEAAEAPPEAPEAETQDEAPEAAAEAEEGQEEAAAEEAEAPEAEPVVAKSLRVTTPDGTELEGFDASEIIAELRGELAKAHATIAEQGQVLNVSAGLVKSLHGVVLDHGAAMESMREEIAALGKQGAGRKGVVLAKAAPAKPAEPTYPDVMAKALALQAAGTISGADVNRLVAYTSRGLGVPEDLAPKFAA
jgi:hypothetical protein